MCEGADHRRITRMDADGTVTTIAERWQGKRCTKPNEVVCRSDGSIFVTDPELRLEPALREIGFAGVYRLDPQGQLQLATDACEYPNGLAFSPDESILYVAISRLDQRCFEGTGCEFSVAQKLLAEAQVEGNSDRREQSGQKNGGDSVGERGRECA